LQCYLSKSSELMSIIFISYESITSTLCSCATPPRRTYLERIVEDMEG
jgi:hypothetical protein